MSKRDKARAQFVRNYNKKMAIKYSVRNTLTMERERFLDIQESLRYETDKPLADLKYMELLEVLNKDMEALHLLTGKKNALVSVREEDKKEAAAFKVDPEVEKEREQTLK